MENNKNNTAMETRKNRTPSARMLEAALDDSFGFLSMKMPDLVKSFTEADKREKRGRSSSISNEKPTKTEGQSSKQNENQLQECNEELIDVSVTRDDNEENADSSIDVGQVKVEPILMEESKPTETIEVRSFKTPIPRKYEDDGESLSLKKSDLSVPNKAAHFLYFRCYDEKEVQKEFPLTIDHDRKGFQNFLVEPRVGLRNTDYYIDNYLWNRGKSTSSKKKIFVEVDGNRVKTSRKNVPAAPYVLNWYYSNMESRITKKVCWLETCPDGVRASPVLVQYHVNYVSDVPIQVRKTPKLYSDTRSMAQEMLRCDSPIQTVARFMQSGETDPREVISKKQAIDMRRLYNSKRRVRRSKREMDGFEGQNFFYDDLNGDYYEETVFYGEEGRQQMSDASKIAREALRLVSRKLENRLSALLDSRLGFDPSKVMNVRVPILQNADLQPQADQLAEWINALSSSTSDDVDIVINNVVSSMRKQLDDIVAADGSVITEYLEENMSSSSHGEPPTKRRHIESIGPDGEVVLKREDSMPRVEHSEEGQSYIFDGGNIVGEYVQEVVAQEVNGDEEVQDCNANDRNQHEANETQTEYYYHQETSEPIQVNEQ